MRKTSLIHKLVSPLRLGLLLDGAVFLLDGGLFFCPLWGLLDGWSINLLPLLSLVAARPSYPKTDYEQHYEEEDYNDE